MALAYWREGSALSGPGVFVPPEEKGVEKVEGVITACPPDQRQPLGKADSKLDHAFRTSDGLFVTEHGIGR